MIPVVSTLVLCMASVGAGFFLGSRTQTVTPQSEVTANISGSSENSDRNLDDDDDDDGNLNAIEGIGPCKLVLVVRTDLNMTTGKIAAQCGHATLACYKALLKKNPKLVRHWEITGQAKIALKTDSEDHLMELEAVAKSLNLCARPIHDAGRTQVASGSRTVLGIGPAPVDLINEVTGKLRLL